MLAVNRVTKKYGGFTALEDISIEFTKGVYALLSPNGGGKTTLIKMLVTLLFPTKGEILWDGSDISSLGEEYREIIGYLPQDFRILQKPNSPHLFKLLGGLERYRARHGKEKNGGAFASCIPWRCCG